MKSKKPVAKSVIPADNKVAVKIEESAVQAAPVATTAKSLRKGAPAAVRKPVVKKTVPTAEKKAPLPEEKIVEAVKPSKAPKAEKKPKLKVVRDSFTMPHDEYQNIAALKAICLKDGLQVKKSEVLRAGLKALCAMDAEQMKRILSGLEKIKTGRPNKH